MYICDKCGSMFEEPKMEMELHKELTSPYGTPYEEFAVCPECGSEDMSHAFRCKLCKRYNRNIDYCPSCIVLISAKTEELIESLAEYFPECDDPHYEISECIEQVMG